MIERAQRVVLFLLVSLLFAVQWTSHGQSPPETPMAFVHYSAAGVVVRIDGDVSPRGIHKFSDGEILMTAIKMTAPEALSEVPVKEILQRKIPSAVVITVQKDQPPRTSISVKPMHIKDMMLLGIPLDPDRLSVAEWQELPGIGPSLAHAIINDRQANGAFGSVVALERVPGVGKGKISNIISYF